MAAVRAPAGEAEVAFSPDRCMLALDDVPGQVRFVETETDREILAADGPGADLEYDPAWFHLGRHSPDRRGGATGERSMSGICSLLRRQLKEMGLDWVGPEFPAAPERRPSAHRPRGRRSLAAGN